MAGTEPPPAAPDGTAAIRCAECHELMPAKRVRYREERVKLAPALGRQRSRGPPIFAPVAGRGLSADTIETASEIERIPVCVECLRRQRIGLFGVCGVVAACLIAALLVYSRDEPTPGTLLARLETQSGAVAAPVPMPAPPTLASVAPAPPQPAPAAPASPPTEPPSAPAAVAAAPSSVAPPGVAPPPAATAEPTQNDSRSDAAAAASPPPPVWAEEHKPAPRKPLPPHHPALANALALRNTGYDQLIHRRYSNAISLLQQAAAMGDAYAPMYIGEIFENGLGVARDVGQASYWYGVAIDRGNAAALSAFNRLRLNPY